MPEQTTLAAIAAPGVTNVATALSAMLIGLGGPIVDAAEAGGVEPGSVAKYGAAALLTVVCLLLINSWRQGTKEHSVLAATVDKRHAQQLDTVLNRSDARAERMVEQLTGEANANREFQVRVSREHSESTREISRSMQIFGSKLDVVSSSLDKLTDVQERVERRMIARDGDRGTPAPP